MASETWDSLLDWLKRRQRWYYEAEYRELERATQWLKPAPESFYREALFPVTVPRPIGSLLVFKPDEIGDAVCALPALAELKRSLPETRLYLICLDEARPIYERTGLFHQIASIPVVVRWRRFRSIPLRRALAKLDRREFDGAVFLKTYPPLFPAFLKVPSGWKVHPRDPRLRSGSPYQPIPSLWGEHRAHQSLQLLQIVSAITGKVYQETDIAFPQLAFTAEDRAATAIAFEGKEPPARYWVIHPFAKFETRRYPMEYWKRLIDSLQGETGVPAVIIGGRSDRDDTGLGGIHAEGRLTLGQTAYLISRSAGFVGNSSGPSHLAGALGVPTVTLMSGASAPVEWAPRGKSFIVRADVPCAPCHRWSCPDYGLACLKELTPEKVLPGIRSFLENR